MCMKTHPSTYQKKKFLRRVFDLPKSTVNSGESGSLPVPAGPRATGGSPGTRPSDTALCELQAQTPGLLQGGQAPEAPRSRSQFRSKEVCTVQWYTPGGQCYHIAPSPISNQKKNNQNKTKKASNPNLAPGNQQASLYEGILRINHRRGLPSEFSLPHDVEECRSRDCLTFTLLLEQGEGKRGQNPGALSLENSSPGHP